jgi:ABC-2 type transport system permease protein
LAVLLLFTLGLPLTLATYGSLDWAPVFGAYVASLLLAGAYIAVGMFWSSLTRDQIVALLLSLVSLLLLYAFGFPVVAEWIAGFLPTWGVDLLSGISPYKYFESISRGVFDTRDVVYYLCFCGFFLHANALVLNHRRLKG